MSIIDIDCNTLKEWLENNEAILIDVRELSEHQANRIKQAQLIPLGELSITALPALKNKKLVLHCQHGKRSFNGCNKLLMEDPNLEIYNLSGGIYAWNHCEYETVTQ